MAGYCPPIFPFSLKLKANSAEGKDEGLFPALDSFLSSRPGPIRPRDLIPD